MSDWILMGRVIGIYYKIKKYDQYILGGLKHIREMVSSFDSFFVKLSINSQFFYITILNL